MGNVLDQFAMNVRKKFANGNCEVQFKLSQYGIQIIAEGRTLVKKSFISANDYQKVLFTKNPLLTEEPRLSTWSFTLPKNKTADANTDKFMIENVYLDQRPRLICSYQDPSLWSSIVSSNRNYDGYQTREKCMWKLIEIRRLIDESPSVALQSQDST